MSCGPCVLCVTNGRRAETKYRYYLYNITPTKPKAIPFTLKNHTLSGGKYLAPTWEYPWVGDGGNLIQTLKLNGKIND